MARNSSAAARRGSLQAGAAPVSVSTAAKGASASAPAAIITASLALAGTAGWGRRFAAPCRRPSRWRPAAPTDRPGRRPVAPAHRRRRATAPSTRRPAPATGRPRAWPAGLAPDQRFQQRYQDGAAREDQRDIRGAGVLRADVLRRHCHAHAQHRQGSSEGRPRRSAWRCRYSAGAAIGSRISSAISQRPKARKTGKGGVVGSSGRHHVEAKSAGALKAWPCRQGPGRGVLRVLRCEA